MSFLNFLLALTGLGIGFGLGYVIRKLLTIRSKDAAEIEAASILTAAKTQEKDILLHAKEKAIKVIEEAKQEESSRRKDLQQPARKLKRFVMSRCKSWKESPLLPKTKPRRFYWITWKRKLRMNWWCVFVN